MTDLTVERLREVLDYDPDTGTFRWRDNISGWRKVDRVAGSLDRSGYRIICIDYKRYRASRLAWLYVHEAWPSEFIDHINMCKDDDRISNLREATNSQNAANRPVRIDSSTGIKGVYRRSSRKRSWRALIAQGGRTYHLGAFETRDAAQAAYLKKAQELFAEFVHPSVNLRGGANG